ncbi:MAG: hypothetical protein U9Q69_00865 [Nanoarchaeota archaeon]|nr:hypothetical protein [Nanoarchaeota archaeon]
MHQNYLKNGWLSDSKALFSFTGCKPETKDLELFLSQSLEQQKSQILSKYASDNYFIEVSYAVIDFYRKEIGKLGDSTDNLHLILDYLLKVREITQIMPQVKKSVVRLAHQNLLNMNNYNGSEKLAKLTGIYPNPEDVLLSLIE